MTGEFSVAAAATRAADAEQSTHPLDEFASTSPPPVTHRAQQINKQVNKQMNESTRPY